MNDLEDALRRTAERATLVPADFAAVRARARSIRRRRAALAVGGSVAAVAAIAGVGLTLAPHGADHAVPPASSTSAVPVPDATSSPAATRSASETPSDLLPAKPETGTHYTVRLDGLQPEDTFNDALRVPYWSDGEITDTDGTTVTVTERPATFAKDPATGDLVVILPDADHVHGTLVRLDGLGHKTADPVETFTEGLAVDQDGRLATITQEQGRWVLTAPGRTFDLGGTLDYARVDGFLPNGDVAFETGTGREQVAHVADGTVTSLAHTSMAVPSPTGAVAWADDNATWSAQDATGSRLWTLSWSSVGSFSHDGRYVALVGDPQQLVPGSTDWDSDVATSTLWIRTAADLGPVAVFTAPAGGYFGSWTWEGDDLVADVYDHGTWTPVRLSADGVKVARGGGQPGGAEAPTYLFGAGPVAERTP